MDLFIHQEHNKDSNLIDHPIKHKIHHIGNYKYAPQSCRQLMWCLNIIAQERNISSYCHKPVVQRWTTLPSSSWRCWRCWRGWRCNRGWLLQRSPLQSSQVQPPFRVFHVSPLSPFGNAPRSLYIVSFRSNPTI